MSKVGGGRIVGVLVLLVALAVALPAAAYAAPSWHTLPSPPDAASIAAGGGRVYVANVSGGNVRVSALTELGWQQVGGAVAHNPDHAATDAKVTVAGDGHPWVVWLEANGKGIRRVRVARLTNGSWHEVAAGAAAASAGDGFDYAENPQLAFAGGHAYVSYYRVQPDGFAPPEFKRLSNSGRWERLGGVWDVTGNDVRMASAGGRLYVSIYPSGGQGIELFRSTEDGSSLESFGSLEGGKVIDLAALNGRLGMLYFAPDSNSFRSNERRVARYDASNQPAGLGGVLDFAAQALAPVGGTPHVGGVDAGFVRVASFGSGSWSHLPDAGGGAISFRALLDVGGAPWVLYDTARALVLRSFGEGYPELPAGTRQRGACGLITRGGPGNDTLIGGTSRDEIFGFAGDDRLLGRSGRDCLHGGAGHDVIDGGPGADTIYARGGGADRIDCGSGRDVLYAARNDRWRNCERVLLPRLR